MAAGNDEFFSYVISANSEPYDVKTIKKVRKKIK